MLREPDAAGLPGFVWVIPDADPVHGHLIDNLHVAPDCHGRGIGRRLLRAIAAELDAGHGATGVYLWVYATNTRARQFYARCGANVLEGAERTTVEGHPVAAYRMEAPDRGLLDQWMAAWADIVDHDVIPVITSAEAAARVPNDTAVTG